MATRTTRYVAFLRAVNVGGRVVKMDRLRRLFESLGYSGVQTFIASGNVVFESAKAPKALEREIEAGLQKAFGFPIATFVRSVDELAAVADHQPFPAMDGGGLYVAFLKDAPPESAQRRLLALANDVDDFRVRGREVYWLVRGRFSDSKVAGPVLGKALGTDATVRNSTTVRKMAGKFATRT
jgi:uncharacterized protein (DUF1697 family)